VQTCIWLSLCHCYSLSLASLKSRLVLPFWYRLTRVVPEKGPLNGCVCVTPLRWYCVCLFVCLCVVYLSVHKHLSGTTCPVFTKFSACYLWPKLSSFGGVAIYYVIPVLWMALCLHIMARNSRHQYTHPFNGSFSGTTQVSQYQTGKTSLDYFTEASDSEWKWHQLGRMQVCTSLQIDNHASTPPLSIYRPDALPTAQPTASNHWRISIQ